MWHELLKSLLFARCSTAGTAHGAAPQSEGPHRLATPRHATAARQHASERHYRAWKPAPPLRFIEGPHATPPITCARLIQMEDFTRGGAGAGRGRGGAKTVCELQPSPIRFLTPPAELPEHWSRLARPQRRRTTTITTSYQCCQACLQKTPKKQTREKKTNLTKI